MTLFKKLSLVLVSVLAFGAVKADTIKADSRVQLPTPISPVAGEIVLTSDNTLVLNDAIFEDTASKLATKAKEMDAKLPSGDPIILVLNSPGGSIEDGLQMLQVLKNLNRPINTLSIFSASMAFHTVQGLGARYVQPTGVLMSHKAKGMFYGEFPGQLDSRYGFYLQRVRHMDEEVVRRTNGKHTYQTYSALIENEYWCEGQDCVNQGFADSVANARCDASLNGTRSDVIKLFFMGARIQISLIYANCPLITGVLDYDISVDGQKLFKDATKKDGSTYYDEQNVTLSKDELKLLDVEVQRVIKEKTSKNVVKGY